MSASGEEPPYEDQDELEELDLDEDDLEELDSDSDPNSDEEEDEGDDLPLSAEPASKPAKKSGFSALSGVWLIALGVWVVVLVVIFRPDAQQGGPAGTALPSAALSNERPNEQTNEQEGEAAGSNDRLPTSPKGALAEESDFSPEEMAAKSKDSDPAEEGEVEDGVDEADQEPGNFRLPRPWVRSGWDNDYEVPDEVRYTIRRGGTAKRVANLFKIYHHEIAALNPGVNIDQEQPPKTKVVVYKDDGEKSRSIGSPTRGSLKGAVPMMEGPGRELRATPWKMWAMNTTVAVLDDVLRTWAETRPNADPILVGNMSSREGGRLKPHSSHQSGLDADLSYPQKRRSGEEYNWREMTADNLDAEATWALLKILADTGAVEVVLIDRSIQELLYRYAEKHELMSKGMLNRWLQHPGGRKSTFVQHHPGHVDHLHVRFACPKSKGSCQ